MNAKQVLTSALNEVDNDDAVIVTVVKKSEDGNYVQMINDNDLSYFHKIGMIENAKRIMVTKH